MTSAEQRTAIDRLSAIELFDYFKQHTWPEWVEPTITRLVAGFADASVLERRHVLAHWKMAAAPPMGWYARRMAGVAVRRQMLSDARHGLIALTLAAADANNREHLPPLALLYDSAQRVDGNADALFGAVAKLFAPAGRQFIESFLAREPQQKSATTFGFHAGAGPEGFDYLPLP